MRSTEDPRVSDPGLQPERTALAWRRTALALTTTAIVEMRILPELLGIWAMVPAGTGIAGALAILCLAHRRHLTVHRMLVSSRSDRVPLPGGALLLCAALLVGVVGLTSIVAVLQGSLSADR